MKKPIAEMRISSTLIEKILNEWIDDALKDGAFIEDGDIEIKVIDNYDESIPYIIEIHKKEDTNE